MTLSLTKLDSFSKVGSGFKKNSSEISKVGIVKTDILVHYQHVIILSGNSGPTVNGSKGK